jgi:hypothetical protein
MGALHAIERSGGAALVPNADSALTHARSALAQLQAQPTTHPAIGVAMEAVASSLSLVHSLTKRVAEVPNQRAPSPPARAGAPAAQVAPPAYASPQALSYARTVAAPAHEPPATASSSLNPPPAPLPAGEVPIVSADLGTSSPTNFYKGLSGNDVIDHGGLFIATYMIPKIGSIVRLKVSLPGGYEFEANGVVRWAREQSDAGDVAPGFGAQFTQITAEARQLVYRYVRNREPLFHDDL